MAVKFIPDFKCLIGIYRPKVKRMHVMVKPFGFNDSHASVPAPEVIMALAMTLHFSIV